MVAARAALADAGLAWRDIQFVAGADTIRNGYPGFIAGATFAQKLGWTGVRVVVELRRVRVGRAGARSSARAQILAGFCDVALVDRRRHHAEGLLRPGRRRAQERPRLAALPPARRDQPDVLRALRAPPHGPLRRDRDDFAQVKVKNSRHGLENPNARFRKESTVDDVLDEPDRRRSAPPARHLRDVRRRGGDDRVEHGLRRSAPRHRPTACRASRRSPPSRRATRRRVLELPDFATDSTRRSCRAPDRGVQGLDRRRAPTRRPASAPTTSSLAEVYDLSTALELDWYENIGLCARRRGRGAAALRRHRRSAAASR